MVREPHRPLRQSLFTILQPVKPQQHPFEAVLILTLCSSQLHAFNKQEMTKPGTQWLFLFVVQWPVGAGGGQEYKGCVTRGPCALMPRIVTPEPDPARLPPGWETDCDPCIPSPANPSGRPRGFVQNDVTTRGVLSLLLLLTLSTCWALRQRSLRGLSWLLES